MVALAAALLIAFAPPYPDRANFLRVLRDLPDRAPREQVLKALGNPDRVEKQTSTVNSKDIVVETWFYGTDGPTGAATLARFMIYDGQLAYHPVFADPPATSVISEAELRKGMHLVLDSMPKEYIDYSERSSGALNLAISKWVARTTNALLPFGESKCKAIVGECGRLMEGYAQLAACPYFLCYSLFDPPKPPGYFDVYGPVWIAERKKDHRDAPRWPVEIINDVPYVRGEPIGGFGGYAPSFQSTFKELRPRIHLRKSPLKEPK